MSNININRMLRAATGISLVYGIALVSGISSAVLSAQLTGQGAILALAEGSGLPLHQAAEVQVLKENVRGQLILGMLMILIAFFFYTLYIVRKQREEAMHPLRKKIAHWFQQCLDLPAHIHHNLGR